MSSKPKKPKRVSVSMTEADFARLEMIAERAKWSRSNAAQVLLQQALVHFVGEEPGSYGPPKTSEKKTPGNPGTAPLLPPGPPPLDTDVASA